jgi:hypothetical protein
MTTDTTGALNIQTSGTNAIAISNAQVVSLTNPLLPASGGTGITSLGTGVATFLGTPSSANLLAAVTDETGTGVLVFGTAPTISSANLTGTPVAPTAAVTTDNTQIATTAFVRDIIPTGIISMWSGSIASIPSGWLLCDGTNGTPDLRNRFIVSAGLSYAPGNTGGSSSFTPAGTVSGTVGGTSLTEAQMPKHYHILWGPAAISGFVQGPVNGAGVFNGGTPDDGANTYGSYSVGGDAGSGGFGTGTSNGNSHTHSLSVSFSGSSQTSLPPYYALAYIMKS